MKKTISKLNKESYKAYREDIARVKVAEGKDKTRPLDMQLFSDGGFAVIIDSKDNSLEDLATMQTNSKDHFTQLNIVAEVMDSGEIKSFVFFYKGDRYDWNSSEGDLINLEQVVPFAEEILHKS
ncbi:hypothetical protein P4K71_24450 [Bacillus cereus]|uniref:hypothetical protein n=1 Tax=Bacillus cereus group TaxID=86661 RepID=UPI000A3B29E0|nr:hypothetical protein [Bacillus thuringiensis]MEB8740791.1 hypothetical protein [Bacillus cereus]MEB8909439.1 hypothetical protein [Bacillus cereus]MEB9925902.1 hypothetical protein [Bacillus cereus]MEB9986870.1 hypothetical protein [Bacillus cereus]MEB9991973.1 hypothetical protein [Bacillus cereus]